MNTVTTVVTVTGAAGIVAGIVQVLKPITIDLLFKQQTPNAYATRALAFLVALIIVALPVYEAHGFHSQGDFLSLCSVAVAVAGEAVLGWHVLNDKLGGTPNLSTVVSELEPYFEGGTSIGPIANQSNGYVPTAQPGPPDPEK